jgi:hypothetical protein
VRVTYEREPSFFAACAPPADCAVLVARDETTDEVVGIACRSILRLFVNGREREIGYLSQLRVDERHRGRWALAKGFAALRALDAKRAIPYLATVVDGSDEARAVLVTRPRRSYPVFRRLGELRTLALFARRARHRGVERLRADDVPELLELLRAEARRHQVASVPEHCDGDGLHAPSIEDWFLVRRKNRIAGAIAVWDQTAFKQTVVRGYGEPLSTLRPLHNACAPLVGWPRLPRVGEPLRFAFAARLAVADDDLGVARTLVGAALDETKRRNLSYLMLGLATGDPLIAATEQIRHLTYRSTIYGASWERDSQPFDELDGRTLRLEIASL